MIALPRRVLFGKDDDDVGAAMLSAMPVVVENQPIVGVSISFLTFNIVASDRSLEYDSQFHHEADHVTMIV